MPVYKYVNGEKVMLAKYTKKGTLTLIDIFPNVDKTAKYVVKRKKYKGSLEKQYGVHSFPVIVRRVFYNLIIDILWRVAQGDVFMFPGKTGAYIALKKTPDKEVRYMRQMGVFSEIDLIKSRFIIPRFTFDFGPKYPRRDRQIYVPRYLFDEAMKNVIADTIPWTTFRKRMNYDNTT